MNEIDLATNLQSNETTSDTEDEIFIIDEGVGLTPNRYEFKPDIEEKIEKKPRGRPRKLAQNFFFDRSSVSSSSTKNNETLKRKRGRPRKEKPILSISTASLPSVSSPSPSDTGIENASEKNSDISDTVPKITNDAVLSTFPKRRGRPPKRLFTDELNTSSDDSTPSRKLPHILADVVNVQNDVQNNSQNVKRKRGRPRKILSNNAKVILNLGKKKGKRGRPRLHDMARTEPKFQRSSDRIRRTARVLSPEFNSSHVLKNKTTMVLPLDIPVSQIDPDFSKEEALSDLTALYNTVPDGMTYLFHAQVRGFIITLKEIMPNFNRDSSPRI